MVESERRTEVTTLSSDPGWEQMLEAKGYAGGRTLAGRLPLRSDWSPFNTRHAGLLGRALVRGAPTSGVVDGRSVGGGKKLFTHGANGAGRWSLEDKLWSKSRRLRAEGPSRPMPGGSGPQLSGWRAH